MGREKRKWWEVDGFKYAVVKSGWIRSNGKMGQ